MPSKQNTGAVVVVFNPEVVLEDHLRVIGSQVTAVLVVDNTPSDNQALWLSDLAETNAIELVSNGRNLGIGAALNQGVEWANAKEFKWLLTFDQDTLAYDTLLPTLAGVYTQHPDPDSIAVLGSNYDESHREEPFWNGKISDPHGYIVVPWVITSGSLLSLEAVKAVGMYRDEWFVDLIDVEYCLRARAKGFKVLLATTPLIRHEVGDPTLCSFLGRKLTTPNHSPSRHYYATRNNLVLIREYLFKDRKVVQSITKARLKETILMLCCERSRYAKVAGIVRGAFDALRGRMGTI